MSSLRSFLSLDQTHGVLLIGTLLSSALYGLTSHQTYRYFRRFPNDAWSLRALVTVLWVADTCFTAASFHWCYFYLIIQFGNPLQLLYSTWSLRMGVVMTFIIGMLSNIFYVTRLNMMGLNRYMCVSIVLLTILPRCAFEIAIFVKVMQNFSFLYLETFRWMIDVAFAFAGASNTTLAGALSYVLKQKRTGHSGTDSKIDVLVMYTVNTGLLSSVLSLIGLFSTLFTKTFLFLAVLSILTKIYVNSVLAVLNSRRTMHKIDESVWEYGAFESSWKPKQERQHHLTFTRESTLGQVGQPFQRPPIQISISETKTMHGDEQEGSVELKIAN